MMQSIHDKLPFILWLFALRLKIKYTYIYLAELNAISFNNIVKHHDDWMVMAVAMIFARSSQQVPR